MLTEFGNKILDFATTVAVLLVCYYALLWYIELSRDTYLQLRESLGYYEAYVTFRNRYPVRAWVYKHLGHLVD